MNTNELIEKYINSDTQTQQQIELKVGQSQAKLSSLLCFISECAVLAVRHKDKLFIEKGLYANVIEGGRQDSRDNIAQLTKLYHSCILLGLNPDKEFHDIANKTNGEGKKLIKSFANRKPVYKTLKCMGLKTTLKPQFDFVWDDNYTNETDYSEPTDKKLMATTNNTLPKAWQLWLKKLLGSD